MSGLDAEPATERFRAAIGDTLGLRVESDRLPVLAELLATRLSTTGHALAGYLARLTHDPAEQAEVVATLAVHETYFMRNPAHFAAFSAFVRARAETGARSLRVLSAGCATGEEAYSIAITVHRALEDPADWDLRILGVDASPRCIASAKEGSYGPWALRGAPPDVYQGYFTERRGVFAIAPAIKRLVRFERRNLIAPNSDVWQPNAYDAIFCRNVLMYLTPDAAHTLVARLESALEPAGPLFIGHAETLLGRSAAFELENTHATFYYRRATSRAAVAVAPPPDSRPTRPSPARDDDPAEPAWCQAIARSAARVTALTHGRDVPRAKAAPGTPQSELASLRSDWGPRVTDPAASPPPPAAARRRTSSQGLASSALDRCPASSPAPARRAALRQLVAEERFQDAIALLGPAPDDREELLTLAALLVASGDTITSRAAARRLLARDDLDADAHYVLALCHEDSDEPAVAREHLRSACYLDPGFAMPHMHRALAARRAGDVATARRELELVVRLLPDEHDARVRLFGGGFGRDALIALCRAELIACGDSAP